MTEKSGSGVDRERSTARTGARASHLLTLTIEYCAEEGCELEAETGGEFCAFHECLTDAQYPADRIPRARAHRGDPSHWDGFGLTNHLYFRSDEVVCKCGEQYCITTSGKLYCRPCAKRRMREMRARNRGQPTISVALKTRRPAMYSKGGQLSKLRAAIMGGFTAREAARAVGCDKNTANRCQRLLRAEGIVPICECGKPASHRGWCAARFARSPARQDVIRRLHDRQRQLA